MACIIFSIFFREGGIVLNCIKLKFSALFSALGIVMSRLCGGLTADLKTLLFLMAADFASGFMVAAVFKKSPKSQNGALQSKAGFAGISRKCLTLCFVMIAHRVDLLLGVNFVRSGVIFAYIANETVSVIENAGIMGVPVPAAIRKAVDILKTKSDGDQE